MIFDKEANLKYASLKDEEIDENLTSYNPLPIIYKALSFESLPDNKLLVITDTYFFYMILNLLYLLVYVQLTIYISQLLLNIFCPDCHQEIIYFK